MHGLRLLEAHRDGSIPFGTDPDLPGLRAAAEHTAIERLLDRLADDEDAIADLLLAEGVFQALRGNHERAGERVGRRRRGGALRPSPSSSAPRRRARR